MAKARRVDPLRNFKFLVQIIHNNTEDWANDMDELGFMSVSGISVQNEMIPYREGGMNTSPHKMPGQTDFAPITLVRGTFFQASKNTWGWQNAMHRFQWGSGNLRLEDDFRADVIVSVLEHPVTEHSIISEENPQFSTVNGALAATVGAQVRFYNCWPGSFAFGDMNAGDNSLWINQMVLHHEGFDFFPREA